MPYERMPSGAQTSSKAASKKSSDEYYAEARNNQREQLQRQQMLRSIMSPASRNQKQGQDQGIIPHGELQDAMQKSDSVYDDILDWLDYKAKKQGKVSLLQFLRKLTWGQQMDAIHRMAGTSKPTMEQFAEVMSTRNNMFFKKTVDWDKFAAACKEAEKSNTTEDYNNGRAADAAALSSSGGSAALGAAGFASKMADFAGSSGASDAAEGIAPFAAGLSALASGVQVYKAIRDDSSTLRNADKYQNLGTGLLAGAADTARFSAQSAKAGGEMAGHLMSSAATTAAAATGIIAGSAYLAGGAYGFYKHGKRADNLNELAANHEKDKDDTLLRAAKLGASTQSMNRTASAVTATKGAAMIAGGALLLAGVAVGATPVGWVVFALAGLAGGAYAMYKYFQKRRRKEELVDEFLKVEEHMADPKDQEARSGIREGLLHKQGFNSVAQCYAHIVMELANTVYKKGVVENDDEYRKLIENIGFTVDQRKQEPKPAQIAKKLDS